MIGEKCNEKCKKIVIMVAVSVFEIGTGFYVGFVQKDIVLLASVLVTIVLFVGLLCEFTWLFKDHLNKNERRLAKSMDINSGSLFFSK